MSNMSSNKTESASTKVVPPVATTSLRQRSLREKVLKKETVAKSVRSEKLALPLSRGVSTVKKASSEGTKRPASPLVPPRRKRVQESRIPLEPKTPEETQVQEPSEASALSSAAPGPQSVTDSVNEKVINWEQCGISPPKQLMSDDESFTSFLDLATPITKRVRRSMLVEQSNKRMGVEMDMATKLANDQLLKGKEALEAAGNMKRECKVIALEGLQTLYEIVLSLSDSRSRHITNLEKERKRHAIELVRVERAHNKHIADVTSKLTHEMSRVRSDIETSLKETRSIRDWQGYETQEPHRLIKETAEAIRDLDKRLRLLGESIAKEDRSKDIELLRRDDSSLKTGISSLQNQLDELRRCSQKEQDKTQQILETNTKTLAHLESIPPQNTETGATQEILEIREILTAMSRIPKVPEPVPQQVLINIEDHMHPITERLEAVSSELRTMREEKMRILPPAPSLEDELLKAEAKSGARVTYAKIAAKPKPQRPNHTLIVTSTNPLNTGDNVIDRIVEALDTRTSGARVDRVRKAKNGKVVLSCGSKEDLVLVQSRVRTDKGLKAEVAKAGNPLIIVRDVLSHHKDSHIVETLLSQNSHLLRDVDLKECTIKVRYRKKARNTHECHLVLEVSPPIHKRFIEAEKVHIGIQRRPVFDHSPLVQCSKCLGFGHTRALCQEREDLCSHCGRSHSWEVCKGRQEGNPPKCRNCVAKQGAGTDLAHNAFSNECPERHKWDAIARSRVSYC